MCLPIAFLCVFLYQVSLAQCQALLVDECKPSHRDDNDMMMMLRQLQNEFSTYRTDTKHEIQQLKDRLNEVETELEDVKGRLDAKQNGSEILLNSTNDKQNGTDLQLNSTKGQCCLKIIF